MKSIKEEAQAYEPTKTLNVADLKSIPKSLELHEATGESDGKEFKYRYIVIEGQNYRMPGIVLGDIKALLGKIPDLRAVSVLRSGTGLKTRYQVIPYTAGELVK